MKWLRDASISLKLNVLSSFTVAAALVVCGAALIAAQVYGLWQAKESQVGTLAEVVGSNCSAALEFDDPQTASRLLSSLQRQPTILEAVILNSAGRVFVAYRDEGRAGGLGGTMTVEREIRRNGESLGSIRITANFADVWQQVGWFIAFAAATLTVTLALTIAAGRTVQRQLREPILQLATAVRRVTREHDLSARVPASSKDELGLLCDGFNEMLGWLNDSRDALQAANQGLEQRVRERTADLQKALEQAEAANAAKTNFLANMSHEIRTPMTAILGYLEFLEEDTTSREQRLEYVQTVRRNSQHLLGIINDILDLSKIEAGRMELERIPCSLRQIAYEVASLMAVRAKEKGLELKFEVRGHVPEQIQTDPMRLKQIIMNLVGNAIKFTERGRVELIVGMTSPDEKGCRRARFTVRDTGIGMAPEVIHRIFHPFTQADESMTRRFGGTGLGLSISRRLAVLLGGEIAATSVAGIGSEFVLDIDPGPLNDVKWVSDDSDTTVRRELSAQSSEVLALPSGLRVLLVEDSNDNQLLITSMLRRGGIAVTLAENGLIGMQQAEKNWAAGEPFDVILMDMQMPEMDGYEATRRLREGGYTGKIVALTAHAMSSDRVRCLDAGCDDFATKPLDRRTLYAVIQRQVAEQSPSPVAGTPSA
ncbi:MAG: response regulator [Pirellulales bacterium]